MASVNRDIASPVPEMGVSKRWFKEPLINVIPAKAGIHNTLISLDPHLRKGGEAEIEQGFLN